MQTHEAIPFSNISATTDPFRLQTGGRYSVAVVATFGGGSVKLQQLGPDGSTYLDQKQAFDSGGTEQDDVISTFVANGVKVFDLAPGQYRLTVATASAIYAVIARVPIA